MAKSASNPDGCITFTKRRGGVVAIGIDRVAKRNSFTPSMLDDLAVAYTRAKAIPKRGSSSSLQRVRISPAAST